MINSNSDVPNSGHNNPFTVIAYATKAVPFVKYALGLAGIVAAISIVKALGVSLRIAAWGTVVTLCLMLILFLLAKASQTISMIQGPSIVLLWAIVMIFILIICCLFSSIFFRYPLDLCKWIDPGCSITKNIVPTNYDSIKEQRKPDSEIYSNKMPKTISRNRKIEKKTITLSIQLRNETDGYKKIYYNGNLIDILPESTKFNPRIEVDKGGGKLVILTNHGDTCYAFIPKALDSSIYRIIPQYN